MHLPRLRHFSTSPPSVPRRDFPAITSYDEFWRVEDAVDRTLSRERNEIAMGSVPGTARHLTGSLRLALL